MRKLGNTVLLTVFVLGVIVGPAIHRARCAPALPLRCSGSAGFAADSASRSSTACPALFAESTSERHDPHGGNTHESRHDAGECPFCQIANMPLAVSVPVALPPTTAVASPLLSRPVIAPSLCGVHLHPLSRGPPA